MKIILIGFMGSGKSTVSKQLGLLLKQPVIEMDELVLHKTSAKNMHEVFSKGGELLLRETEIALAQEYASIEEDMIISTGAGVVLNKITLDYLKAPCDQIFFLNACFETIAERLVDDKSRPLFKNIFEAKSLYQFRQPLYLKYADQIINVDNKSIEDVALEIAKSQICTNSKNQERYGE
ncbi:MAG: shikimate kinase [Parachlamydiaceae bacterium]|nr:shikimate kinase [Parachlamydiaceae bacterium]